MAHDVTVSACDAGPDVNPTCVRARRVRRVAVHCVRWSRAVDCAGAWRPRGVPTHSTSSGSHACPNASCDPCQHATRWERLSSGVVARPDRTAEHRRRGSVRSWATLDCSHMAPCVCPIASRADRPCGLRARPGDRSRPHIHDQTRTRGGVRTTCWKRAVLACRWTAAACRHV